MKKRRIQFLHTWKGWTMSYKTFTVGSNAKTIKGDGDTYETAITYMKPYKTEVNGKVHNL